jgi:hypothetical protein
MPRDTRPIKRRWQREKSVKIMKSLKREGAISSLCEPFLIFPDIDFGRDPASVKMRIFSDAGAGLRPAWACFGHAFELEIAMSACR